MQLTAFRAEQDPREDLNRGARRHRSSDDGKTRAELVSRAGDLHAGADHHVCLNHLEKNLLS
jgi:hypothetical protein